MSDSAERASIRRGVIRLRLYGQGGAWHATLSGHGGYRCLEGWSLESDRAVVADVVRRWRMLRVADRQRWRARA